MPQSLSAVVVHIVFATYQRTPFLSGEILDEAHRYIATVARDAACGWVRVGGVADHIHVAASLPRTLDVARLVAKMKANSSRWLKQRSERLQGFGWQRGYASFSISPSHVEALVRYIDGQAEHHRQTSFQDEYRTLLKKAGIQFDEADVWD